MARIRKISRGTSASRVHPTEVDCEVQVIDTPGGRLLQLSTFGSDGRVREPKVSQTIQFDATQAAALAQLIHETFPPKPVR